MKTAKPSIKAPFAAGGLAMMIVAVGACGPDEPVVDRPEPAPAPARLDVEDFNSQNEGFTASVWVQGNSSFAEGAEACWQDSCATADEDGFAYVAGLPAGEVAIRVDAEPGVPLLIPLTLSNHWVPHLAARSLTPGVYSSWMDADAWPSGTALIDIWPDDATEAGAPLIAGMEVTATDGDIWTVHDLSYATEDNVSTGTGPVWVAGVTASTVELTLTFDGGLCSARSMGWEVTAEGNTLTMTVPTERDRATSIYVQCVPTP